MKRASLLLALPLLAAPILAACSDDRALSDYIPVADPLREPARAAPFEYGRSGWIQGSPVRAAQAAAEIEAFTDAAENDPLWTHPRSAVLLPQLQIARREFREALGVSPRIPSAVAARSFATAAEALRRYNEPAAAAALGPVGGTATLARLSNLPRLPRVEEAAQAVAIEVNQPGRNR
ncbi:hypothetical protein [Roseomonas populi]|uniref:Uncharacterized protein n=1 Tax=Roseomonas populi TaxID=3121582 RepID=A0ABT1X290_9PROT|nr:hypothetical protein [Roseomonas pecuniae]MCR0982211.1 hypothetical protein [Roseomonas pecuniae]